MSLAEDVFSALAGGTPAMRVYPDVAPQLAHLPFLVYTLVGGTDDFHLGGKSGLTMRLVQVDAWASTRLSADQMMSEATLLMVASGLFQVNAIDVSGADGYEAETERYRASRDFTLWIQE